MRNSNPLKVYTSISDFNPSKKTIATLGTFDGVHSGHRKIITRLIKNAEDDSCESVILTFFPHPRMVLQRDATIKLLNTIDEKSQLLEQQGLDNLIIHPFDTTFSQLSAEEFVKSILVDRLNIKKIIIGHDHRFGKNRTADINDLIVYGKKYGFEVEQISAREIDDVAVSSTKIRTALTEGNIELANDYLGYDYFLTGTIVKGRQLGRTIGFPTANLNIAEEYKQIPKSGVYVVSTIIDQKKVFGMMNIGTNPTVGGKQLSIESYFFDFDADIYDTKLRISLLHRLRDEHKFASVDLLKKQLHHDQEASLSYLRGTKQ